MKGVRRLFVVMIFILTANVYLVNDGFAIEHKNLGRCLDGYFENIDLNNDGQPEIVKVTSPCRIFTNVSDNEWGDERVAIEILNEKGEQIFLESIEEILEMDDVHIVDEEGNNGFRQIFISGLNKHSFLWERYWFGFKDGKYQMIKDRNKNVR